MEEKRFVSALSDNAHEVFREEVQEFVTSKVVPKAAELEETESFPWDIIHDMGKKKWMALPIPVEFGGAGKDNLSYIIAIEELARASGSVAITLAAHTSLVVWPIFTHGSDVQKNKYLPLLGSGEQIGSFGLTENNAGSDAGATETMAIPENGGYIVNGSKRFITNGTYADTIIFTASHDPSLGVHGISAFVIEKGTPGFRAVSKEDKLGLRASDTAELIFEDCHIEKANLIGEENDGFKVFMETLDGGRISIGALALGEAQGALDAAVQYVQSHDMKKSQLVQKSIADMAMDVAAARHLIYHAAKLKDSGIHVTMEGAMAKCYASEAAMRVCSKAMDIMGLDGVTKQSKVQRCFCDAKLNEIGEGTSEIQRIVIARKILGK